MFRLDDLDVFDVLYFLDDLDFLDVLDVLDILDVLDDLDLLDLLDLAKVCSEKISLIELHCRNVKLIFHSPYGQICSEAISGMGWVWMEISVWGYCMSTALRC